MGTSRDKFFADKEKALKQMRDLKFKLGETNKNISDENFPEAIVKLKEIKKDADEIMKVLK